MKTTASVKIFCLLTVVFLCTVVMRLPTLNRPLSKHHEFTTAFILRIQQIWWEQGAGNFHFNPVMNYGGASNKYINNQTFSDFDEGGNSYYISYPPGAYLLPYAFFKMLNIYPDVLPIEIYNLILQFVGGLFLFLIFRIMIDRNSNQLKNILPVVAAIFYWTSPCMLWFYSNVYMVDMPAAVLMIASIYFLLKWKSDHRIIWLILLGANVFLMTYTEYLGITFCMSVTLYLWVNRKEIKPWFAAIAVLFFTSSAAIILTAYQYSLIKGWDYYKWFFSQRYSARSGYHINGGTAEHLKTILNDWLLIGQNYLIGFMPIIFLILGLFIISKFKTTVQKTDSINIKSASILFMLPVLLHHVIFLDASLYDFFVVKAAPFIVLIFVWFAIGLQLNQKAIVLAIAISVILNFTIYFYINRPGKISQSGDEYDSFNEQGNFIIQHTSKSDVVFLKDISDEPQLVFYAKKNLRTIQTNSDAISFLKQHHLSSGKIFSYNSSHQIILDTVINVAEK